MPIDLHAHTTASDGVLAPAELIALALQRGLTALAVTDHDSTEGIAAAEAAARDTRLTLVPGVELSSDVADGEIHLLGYFVDASAPALQAQLDALRDGRLRRGERIVERLAAAKVTLSWNRVLKLADGGAVGRPHVARALIEAGYATSNDDAFTRYLVRGRPGYVARQRFTPSEAVQAILAAGGVPTLAHPLHGVEGAESSRSGGVPFVDEAAVEARVAELLAAGLRGLEVYYPGYEGAGSAFLEGLADRYGLIRTGGSDFHGPGRAELGSVAIPRSVESKLIATLRAAARSTSGH